MSGEGLDLNLLEVDNISLSAGSFSLTEISFSIVEGEYMVLAGSNGAGKSLLIQAICGLMPISSGEIRIGGDRVDHLPPSKRHIGYVPQGSNLFPHLSVEKNIAFSLDVTGCSQAESKRLIDDISSTLNINHLRERRTVSLSGGEKQRVALARALIFRPSLLIMDEPLSEIDEDSRAEVCKELKGIQRSTGITTIHISHSRLETSMVADKITTLKEGILTTKVDDPQPNITILTGKR